MVMQPMPDYIFDTTVLSNFASAGRVDLLEKRYRGSAFTTMEVTEELRKGVKAGYLFLEYVLKQIEADDPEGWLRILIPDSVAERRLRSEFDQILDPGEASCLALAISRVVIFVTDDLAARRLAEERGVSLSGTLGILIALVRDKAFSLKDANAMLAEMIQRHYRAPVDHLDEFI
jgi:predicted nucleic acid-binding protein